MTDDLPADLVERCAIAACMGGQPNVPQVQICAILREAGVVEMADRVAKLEAALRYGAGAAINELVARDHPTEWSPKSGIGVMLAALGCKSTRLDDEARAALSEEHPAGSPGQAGTRMERG